MTTPATEIQSNEQVADQQQQVEQIEVELDIGAVEQEGEVETGEPLIEAPEGQAVQYNKTGDPGLDMALSFIGKLGIGPDHPAIVAARQGDFAFIKAELAGRGDKAQGWEQYLSLAEKAFEN